MNPIEPAFSKFKKLHRDGTQRTNNKLWRLCGQVLQMSSAAERQSYFRHCV